MNVRSTMIAAAASTLLACARHREAAPPQDDTVRLQPTKDDAAERTAAAQKRIAGAFYSSIVPKLKTCWDQVNGTGEVQFKYTYRVVRRDRSLDGNAPRLPSALELPRVPRSVHGRADADAVVLEEVWRLRRSCVRAYSDFSEAMSIEKRYFTSDLASRS